MMPHRSGLQIPLSGQDVTRIVRQLYATRRHYRSSDDTSKSERAANIDAKEVENEKGK
jgi:hypothetical protein